MVKQKAVRMSRNFATAINCSTAASDCSLEDCRRYAADPAKPFKADVVTQVP